MSGMNQRRGGFTIVELLIVIVVIGILAAITLVAYGNIQQRTKNTAIIAAVNQSIKSIQSHVVQENGYPALNNYACITTDSGCVEMSGTVRTANATFDTNIAKVGTIPRTVPNAGTTGNGIIYHHSDTRLFDGQPRRALLMYFLDGQSQKCGVQDVMTAWGTPGQDAVPSTTGYTANNTTYNKTVCFISLQ